MQRGMSVLLFSIVGFFFPDFAQGQVTDFEWIQGPPTNIWNDPANWTPPFVPSATGNALFINSNQTAISFSANASVGSMQFFSTTPFSFTVPAGLTFALTTSGIVNFVGGVTESFTVDGTMAFQNNATAGNASITINTGGTTIFSGTSTSGDVTLTFNGGTLQLDHPFSPFTAHSITLNAPGGTIDTTNGNDATIAQVIGGVGGLTKDGGGTLTLTGTNTYGGGTSFNEGILAVESDENLGTGALTFNGSTLEALTAGGGIDSTKLVTLNGPGTFLADSDTTSTLRGLIDGGGSFTKAGAGTLILTADNIYSGGTTISAGTLQLGNGGTTGSILGDVTDDGTLVFNRSGDKKTFDGIISGTGNLVKLGSDTLVLTANNTYSGGTIIGDGTLVAGIPPNSALETSTALGTGNVFLLGGSLRTPSLDPLTIKVGGNYIQGPKGTLELGVAGINGEDYDHVLVGGNASLNGILAVSSLNGFRPVSGNAFEVLTTINGTRTGEFAQINDSLNNNPNLQRIDVYAPNGAALVYVATTPVPTPSPAPTPSPVPTPPPIVVVIPEPLPPVIPEEPLLLSFLLRVLNPTAEQLTSMFEISISGANTQRFNLNDRMAQIQRGSTGFVSPISPAPPPAPTGKEIGKKEVAPVFAPGPQNRWGVWVNGWGDWVSVDNDNSVKGYDFTTGGGSVGIDYRITDCLAVGLFGTFAHTWTSLSPGDVDVSTGRGGLYATYWNQGFYVNGGVYGGYNSYDTSRQTLLQGHFANGSTSGYEFSTFVDTGYDFHFGNLSFGPVFAAQYTNVHVDSYTEQAPFLPLNIHSDSEESWRTDLGIQASYTWHVGQITVIPSLWAAWDHEYKYSALPITFSAANFPGVTATAFGPHEGHDSAIINAGVGTQWTHRISTYVGYQGQLGRNNYDANGVTGTVSFSF